MHIIVFCQTMEKILEKYWTGIFDNQNKGRYDIAQDLWNELKKEWGYIYDEYAFKYYYFEGGFEYDDMENFCEEDLFFTRSQWGLSIPYDIWESSKWFYVYFLVPSKYENDIWWELSSRFKSNSFPANINSEITNRIKEVFI